ncbi:hypothetical protein B620_gp37 [Croceibacter phage P2559S]|uniref:hypothetical protein n=1 Tax=Croceibacter phage P2559S TaxID=1176422 RepID=UPI0002688EC0|nr:hypothetical protein B620_gp37 [Croceibacter phage P2559S]AFM54815.1 hypothetical protein P2559S_37 [Croceibacter phage P2559S]
MNPIDRILEQNCKQQMQEFNLEQFKKTHTSLYIAISLSMAQYAREKIDNALTKR